MADAATLFAPEGELTRLARRLYRGEVDGDDRWASVPDLRAVLEEEHGFDVIGSGAGRIVCDVSDEYPELGGMVVKFALPTSGRTDGRIQNRVEAVVAASDHWLSGYAVPHRYVDEDGYVACQPHCMEPSDRQFEGAVGGVAGAGVETPDFYEKDNWGLHHGEARLIDYGFPHTGVDLPDEAMSEMRRVADEEDLDL